MNDEPGKYRLHTRMPAPTPSPANAFLASHAALLLESYQRLLGRPLLPAQADPLAQARALYGADFAVVSHGTEADPVFN